MALLLEMILPKSGYDPILKGSDCQGIIKHVKRSRGKIRANLPKGGDAKL